MRKYLLVPNKSVKSTECNPLHYEGGRNEERLNIPSHQQEGTSTTSFKSNKPLVKNQKRLREKESVTPESPPRNKRKTSKDKLTSSSSNTQNTQSSKTLDRVLTLKDEDLRISWTKSVLESSSKLLSCTKTDFVDLDMSYWNKSAQSFKQNCWFTVKMQTAQKKTSSQRTCSRSSMYLLPETMEDALRATREEEGNKQKLKQQKVIKVKARKNTNNVNKEKAERARKVHLYPTTKEREKLNQWLGIYRWTYNQCVAHHREAKKKPSHQQLRDLFVKDKALEKLNKEWALSLPWDSRDEAAQDFISALKISTKVYNEKVEKEKEWLQAQGLKGNKLKETLAQNVKPPEMKFKCKKKKRTESFFIRYRDWNQKRNCAWLKQIKTRESVRIDYNTRVIKDAIGRYYVVVLKPLQIKKQPVEHFETVVALDPGVRTFLTGFDVEGRALEFGKGGMDVIFKHLYRADKINSSVNTKTNDGAFKYNHKKRQNRKKAMRRLLCKVRDKVKDAHHKISKYLCENYDAVLLPKFNTKDMIKKVD